MILKDCRFPAGLSLACLLALGAPLAAGGEPGEAKPKCPATAEACIRAMSESLSQRGWVGIEMTERDERGRPVVTGVVDESPASRAGFQRGDVLIAFNGVAHSAGEEAVNAEVKRSAIPGRTITIGVERDGRPHELEVTLGRIPEHLLAQWIGQHMLEGHSAPEAPAPAPRP